MKRNLVRLFPKREHLHGATLAQEHLAEILPNLAKPSAAPILFILDLSHAMSITASYIRATLHWALLCGQAEVQQKSFAANMDQWAVRPLPLFPIVAGCSREVAVDVDDFFCTRGLPLIAATEYTSDELVEARLLGSLDSILGNTLHMLTNLGEATAKQLSEQSEESITINGWNNRLADLFLLRLVTRKRDGKFWIYSPVANSFKLWD